MTGKELISKNCPSCGAELFIDKGMENWFCGHCGVKFEVNAPAPAEEHVVQDRIPEQKQDNKQSRNKHKDKKEKMRTAAQSQQKAPAQAKPAEAPKPQAVQQTVPVQERPADEPKLTQPQKSAPAKQTSASKPHKKPMMQLPREMLEGYVPENREEPPAPQMPAKKPEAPPVQEKEKEPELPEFEINEKLLVKYNGKSANVVIPENITKIGAGAFKDNTYIVTVHIPDKVRDIAESAFEGCKALREINLPAELMKISYKMLNGCESLKRITIPEKVTEIMYDAMRSGIEEIEFENPRTSWELDNDFANGSFLIDRKSNGEGVSRFFFHGHSYSAAEAVKFRSLDLYLRALGVCRYCGGRFGLLSKCRDCKRKKDY